MDRNRDETILKATVPQAWVEQLDRLAKQTGRLTNELVQEALARYLESFEGQSATNLDQLSAELKIFKAELAALTQKVDTLSHHSDRVATMNVRLISLEKAISVESAGSLRDASRKQSAPKYPTPVSKAIEAEEDDCDEPDEILTDFLSG